MSQEALRPVAWTPDGVDIVLEREKSLPLLEQEERMRSLVLEHGSKKRRGTRELEPLVQAAKDHKNLMFGIRATKGDDGRYTTTLTYQIKGQQAVGELCSLLDGQMTQHPESEVILRAVSLPAEDNDEVVELFSTVVDSYQRRINADKVEAEQQKIMNKAKRKKRIYRSTGAIVAASVLGGIGYGANYLIQRDPGADFDDKGIVFDGSDNSIGRGGAGEATFSAELYSGSKIAFDDIPEAEEIDVDDGYRRVTIVRSAETGPDCIDIPVAGDITEDSTAVVLTNTPPFPEGLGLNNTRVVFSQQTNSVEICVDDWIPAKDQQSFVVDVNR